MTGLFAYEMMDIDGEMTLVPSLQRRCIPCLEKDAADASDSLHVNLRCVVFGGDVVQRHNVKDNRAERKKTGPSERKPTDLNSLSPENKTSNNEI